MKNTRPIEDFTALVYYNEKLKEQGFLQCDVVSVSTVKDKLVLSGGSKVIDLPLMQTLRNFVTEPEYCFVNLNKLARIDFSLLCALAFPGRFQEKLKSIVNSLILFGIGEIELGGGIYIFSVLADNSIELALNGCKERQEVVYMPSCANSIASGAFSEKRAPRHIISYSTSLKIGAQAFYSSRGLESISAPNGIKSLESFCFFKCRELKSIELNTNIQKIPTQAFWGCTSLSNLKLPKGLKVIESYAFADSGIADIDFSDCINLERIENNAFSHCHNLRSVEFKNCHNLHEIHNYAFWSCIGLQNFDMSDTKIANADLDTILAKAPIDMISFPGIYNESPLGWHITDITMFLEDYHSKLTVKNFPYATIKTILPDFKHGDDMEIKRYNLALFMKTLYERCHSNLKEFIVNGMTIQEAYDIVNNAIVSEFSS